MRLIISIINYRTPELVINCLYSLQNEVVIDSDLVVVVDNASGDNSVKQIEQAIAKNNWDKWVHILSSSINGGFSAGHNLVLKDFIADFYLLLGSDTIVRPGAIKSLLNAMQDRPTVGLMGPRLEWPDATPQISCFRYRSPVSELISSAGTGPITKLLKNYDVLIPISDTPIESEWISFACVIIRRKVIETIGLMDEGYFMYFEDIDYCWRTRNSDWDILYWPEAKVVHLKGGSGSAQADIAMRRRPPLYFYASRSRYFAKLYGQTGLWMANLFWIAGRTISFARELMGNKKPHTCENQIQDIWANWLDPMKSKN